LPRTAPNETLCRGKSWRDKGKNKADLPVSTLFAAICRETCVACQGYGQTRDFFAASAFLGEWGNALL
jgi:hypothetical protein